MNGYCVVAADSSRARFFRLKPVEEPETQSGPNLVESGVLLEAESEMHGRDLFANKIDRHGGSGGGELHEYDDHRDEHCREFERRFAEQIAKESAQRIKKNGVRRLIVASNPRMLGILRPKLQQLNKGDVEVCEYPKDVSKLSPRELHSHLARKDLLPPRQPPSGAVRPNKPSR